MHRKLFLGAGLLAAALSGAALTAWQIRSRASPARLLGWTPEARAAEAKPGAPPRTLSPDDPLLGFSRYLPGEVSHYGAILQAGRLWRAFVGSNAFARIAATPVVKTFLAEAAREVDLKDLPPEGRQALDLLAAAFDSEIAVAVPEEAPSRGLNVLKAIVLSAAVLTPSPSPAGSPAGRLLAEKRAPLRAAWESSLRSTAVPPLVLAARVRDPKRFDEFIRAMLDQGWLGFREGAPAHLRKVLERSYGPVTIGGVALRRIHMDLRELLPAATEELPGELLITKEEREAVLESLRRLSIDLHIGFLGEYFTVVISSDDKLIHQIVDRFEGRSKSTLAASPAFERIRGLLSADSLGVSYSDDRRLLKEFQEGLQPLFPQLLDPQFLSLLGAPPQMVPMVPFLRQDLEAGLFAGSLLREEVITLDRGIRRSSRCEIRDPSPDPGADRLVTPELVPDSAVGYYAERGSSLDDLWNIVHTLFAIQKSGLEPLKAQAAGNPRLAEIFRQQEDLARRILGSIDEKLAPALRGEMGIVLGPMVRLSVAALPEAEGLSIPTLALVVQSPEPEKGIEGFQEVFRAIIESLPGLIPLGPGGPPPIALVKRDLPGIEVQAIEFPGGKIEGFEPHLARLGNALIFSSSFALTRSVAEAAAGKAPRLAASDEHRAMSDFLDPKALQVSYLDGGRLTSALRTLADGVLGAVERNLGKGKGTAAAERRKEPLDQARSFVNELIAFLGCFRGHAASVTRDGSGLVEKEWIHIADLESK